MPQVYVPWTERPQPRFRGLAAPLAGIGQVAYRVFGPPIRRFPLFIFIAGVIVFIAVGWLVAIAVQDAVAADAWLTEAGRRPAATVPMLGTPAWSLEQLERAAEATQRPAPAPAMWPFQFAFMRDIIGLIAIITIVSLVPLVGIWGERKVSGHLQSRVGPMRVGGWHGWSQSLADGIKLIGKEDFVPPQGDGPLFRLAPYFAMVPSLAAFIALPFGAMWVFRDLDVALLFILAMMGIEVVSVILAGWASNNKWSLFGGMREACQVVSYEIPMGMSLLIPVMVAGSLRFTDIAAPQAGGWFTWYVFHSPFTFVAAVTYFIASLASVKRAPFDLPEGESELVSGFHTEYSGFRWSLFFFAEYAAMFVVSGLLVILFLGAWHAPWPAPERFVEAQDFWGRVVYGTFFSGPLIFIFKCSLLLFLQMWLRWTLPRIRIDQVLYSCIQIMLPLVMAMLLGSTFWELMAVQGWTAFDVLAAIVRYGLGAVGLVLAGGIFYVIFYGFARRRTLVGKLGVDLLPGA